MKYPLIFENTKIPNKRYAFIEDSESDGIVGILYDQGKEIVRRFKNEGEVKRKRSALISSNDWRLVHEVDKDTGIKLPMYMYPPWDTQVRWTVQWMESEDTNTPGLKRVIMSSFVKLDEEDGKPHVRYMRDLTEVKEQYDTLKSHGWIEAVQPKIDIKYAPPESDEVKEKRNKEQALQARLMEMLEEERGQQRE